MASTYLSRTPASASNRRTFTWSAWVKRSNLGSSQRLFSASSSPSVACVFGFNPSDVFQVIDESISYTLSTSQVFRDISAWYHFVVAVDTTQATASNRLKLYVNGSQVSNFTTETYPSQNSDGFINNNIVHTVGSRYQTGTGSSEYLDGYMAHVHFTDGTAYDASAFGETDTNGQWEPKTAPSVTYGTNGFFLKFANSGSLGTDSSGNGNDWTKNGSGDQVPDTPDNVFCTLNGVDKDGQTNADGNLKVSGNVIYGMQKGTQGPSSGKWYFEALLQTAQNDTAIGLANENENTFTRFTGETTNSVGYLADGRFFYNDSSTTYSSLTSGDIFQIAFDADTGKIWIGKNNTWQNSGDPAAGTNEVQTVTWNNFLPAARTISPGVLIYNFGQDSSFTANKTAQNNSDSNGYGDFYYAPPSGYLALCTKNLASVLSPTIGDGSEYMNTVLYTATGSNLSITGVGFQPDWVWGKCRSAAVTHRLFDSSRGILKNIISAATNAEATTANSLTSFDSDGFTLGTDDNLNSNTRTYVAWNWKANGGTTSSNTDGDITTTVQANTTSGFSILTWTGNGTPSQSLGHGLGITPKIMIQKNRDQAVTWQIFGSTIFDRMQFDTGGDDGNLPCTFSSTTITLPNLTNNTEFNSSGDNFVSYVFAEIEGYSKFGTYSPPASADSSFVYLGFKPAFVLGKILSQASNWHIADNKRNPFNEAGKNILFPNLGSAEASYTNGIDMLSNGFKVRGTGSGSVFGANSAGITFLYMAFAEHPFVDSTGRPVTAR